MTRMKILMLLMTISSLAVFASCSNETPIEVTQEVQKADTYTIILTPSPELGIIIDGREP
ncbi:MAG: hypothetical protein WCR36_02455 [Bacteroidaceae bacterium]